MDSKRHILPKTANGLTFRWIFANASAWLSSQTAIRPKFREVGHIINTQGTRITLSAPVV
eukprot:scaffold174023_cov23-Prasinocladus_malaysianus.AAC.1